MYTYIDIYIYICSIYIVKKQGDREIHVLNLYHWGPGYHQPYLVVVAPNEVLCCSNRWWPQCLAPFFRNWICGCKHLSNWFPKKNDESTMCWAHHPHFWTQNFTTESIFRNWDILNEFSYQPDLFYRLQMVGTPTIGPRWLPTKHLTARSNWYWALAPIRYLLRKEYRQISPQWHPKKGLPSVAKCEGLTHEIPTPLQTVLNWIWPIFGSTCWLLWLQI